MKSRPGGLDHAYDTWPCDAMTLCRNEVEARRPRSPHHGGDAPVVRPAAMKSRPGGLDHRNIGVRLWFQ